MREERHPGITAAASHTHQGDRVCLENAEHVEYFLEADPVQAELLGEKGKDDLEGSHSGLVLTSLLPVVHQLLNFLPLLGIILEMIMVI